MQKSDAENFALKMHTNCILVSLVTEAGRESLSVPLESIAGYLASFGVEVRVRLTDLGSSHMHLVVEPRLLGGKGGFGKLLRSQKNIGKRTDNFDSCRDLDGRRIRSVKNEERIEKLKEKIDNGVKSDSSAKPNFPPPPSAAITLDDGYTQKLENIRKEKAVAVVEGLQAAAEAAKVQKPVPVKKAMKSIGLYDDEFSD